PRVEQRDPKNIYHITKVADLSATAPNIDWTRFFTSVGLPDLQSVNVAQPKYFAELSGMINSGSLDDWKAYLRSQIIDSAAPTLSSAFVNEDFNFRGKVLSGQKEITERWKRCVRATDLSLGQLLGQEYVKRTFTPEAKAKANQLINNLVAALRS